MKNLFNKILQGVYKSLALWGIIFYITTSIPSFSQQIHTVTPIPKINKKFLVVVHIVTEDSSYFESIQQQIIDRLDVTSLLFEPIGVSFSVCEFRAIDNPRYKILPEDKDLIEITKLYKKGNRINLFIVDDLGAAGKASLGGITHTQHNVGIYIQNTHLSDRVFIHEMGHFFGLDHTFGRDKKIEINKELVDGSNCLTEGDRICDTPADPFDVDSNIQYVNGDCVFTSDKKDDNGDFYSPLVSNVMSYYDCTCDNTNEYFTNGQFKKMVETYSQPYNPSTVIKFVW